MIGGVVGGLIGFVVFLVIVVFLFKMGRKTASKTKIEMKKTNEIQPEDSLVLKPLEQTTPVVGQRPLLHWQEQEVAQQLPLAPELPQEEILMQMQVSQVQLPGVL